MIRLVDRGVRLALGCLAAALMWSPDRAQAQDNYPSRTVKIVVPLPPGAAADSIPRLLAEKLAARWGVAVVVENRPGAALNVGAEAVARAEPDGYTLLASPPPPLAINQSLYSRLAFDPDAFVPVTVMASLPNVLIVNKRLPVSSLADLIAYAKANPGKLSYASAGSGSTPQLAMELLKSLAVVDIVHVPYKGLAPALTDLVGGHVDLMFDNLGNALEPSRTGIVKALAIGSPARIAALPGVPAMKELYPSFLSVTWFAVVAPPRTSPALVEKISSAFVASIRLPDVASRLEAMSITAIASSPAETAAFIAEERERWRKVIVAAQIKAE